MSKPLMNHEIKSLETLADDVDEITDQLSLRAALARLDYLERKVQAAERLRDADMARGAAMLWTAYDDVTE